MSKPVPLKVTGKPAPKTLFRRLAILASLLVLVSVVPCALLSIQQQRREAWKLLEHQARMFTSTLSTQIRTDMRAGNQAGMASTTRQLFLKSSPVATTEIVYLEPNKRSVLCFNQGEGDWLSSPGTMTEAEKAAAKKEVDHLVLGLCNVGIHKGKEVLYCTRQIGRPGSQPMGWIRMGLITEEYRAMLATALKNTLSVVVLAGLVGITASFFVARKMARPVHDLCALARRLAGGELTARRENKSEDFSSELQQLSDDMNSMAENLQASHRETSRNAAMLKVSNAQLQQKAAEEQFLARISVEFMEAGPEKVTEVIRQSLRKLGEHLDVDAAAVYLYCPDRVVLNAEAEWLKTPEIRPCMSQLPAAFVAHIPELETRTGVLALQSIHRLPETAVDERALMLQLGIKSAAVATLGTSDRVVGYLSVRLTDEEREWTPSQIRLLQFCSGIFSNALARREAAEDRERLHAQLLQSQKMEAVGKLSGGIAHDFNNMLVPIVGYSDSILHHAHPETPWLADIREIKRAAESAASLTRQLLTFSRKQIISRTELSLNGHIQSVEKMLRRVIGENVQLQTQLDPALWSVSADAGQIDQCLVNLCVNARHAMPDGGGIRIRTSMIDSEDADFAQPSGRKVHGLFIRLSVTDTGCGMDAATLARIFEPFYSTKGNDGTGLGLSVVHGVVVEHGGWITVESEVGVGTTFHLWLPAMNEPVANARMITAPVPVPMSRGAGQTILLVEDESGVLAFVSAALRQNGYKVVSADCGSRAREIFQNESGQIDLVMSDVVLPDTTGVELLEEFFLLNPNLKALLTSGYSEKAALVDLVQRRDLTFLHKPYTLSALLEAVRQSLQGGGTRPVIA